MSGTPSLIFHANIVKLVSLKSGRGANMGTCARRVLFVLCCYLVSIKSKPIHTSGKLDFGDASSATSLVKNEKRLPITISRALDTAVSPSEISSNISCGPTGCNATHNNNSVETEVVVHVQTKVNLDQTQGKKNLEDTPDVPIVVGYRGSIPDETIDEEQFRNSRPDLSERRYGSSRNDHRPYDDSPVSIGPAYNQRVGPSTSTYYGTSRYRPTTNGYYGPSIPSTSPSYGYYGPGSPQGGFDNNYFRSSTPRPLDINNIRSSVPVPIPDQNRRNYDYNFKENGVEIQIPYFEHTYNKHYFGEEPPPHTVWLGKGNAPNPVEFKTIPRNKWRPSFWNGRNHKYAFSDGGSNFANSHSRSPPFSVHSQPVHHRNHGTECICREHRPDRTESSDSYAASSVNHRIAVPSKDPGTAINDKLAPLT